MQDSSKPSLNKIPFWIADGVFIIAALIIAFGSEGGMNTMTATWMVFCVTLGGLSLIAPYYAEFYTRSRLHTFEHDQQSWDRVRKLDQSLEALAEARTQLDGLAQQDNSSEAVVALETRIGVLEKHVKDFDERTGTALRGFGQQVKEMQGKFAEQLQPLQQQLESVGDKLEKGGEVALPEFPDVGALVDERFEPVVKAIEDLRSSLETLSREMKEQGDNTPMPEVDLSSLESSASDHAARLEQIETRLGELIQQIKERPVSSGRSRGRSSLMSKAFSNTTGAGSTPVIDRIIKSDKSEEGEEELEEDAEFEDVEEVLEDIEDSLDEPLEEAIEDDLEEEDEAMLSDEEGDDAFLEEEDLEDEDEGEEDDVLELGMEENVATERATPPVERNSLGQTRITVHALIGIGNKPYVRGDGPGMSLERGTVMDFVEIGKWEWKTMRAQKPFTFQVWLNDEKPAEGEPQRVEPGTVFSVSPRFPA